MESFIQKNISEGNAPARGQLKAALQMATSCADIWGGARGITEGCSAVTLVKPPWTKHDLSVWQGTDG